MTKSSRRERVRNFFKRKKKEVDLEAVPSSWEKEQSQVQETISIPLSKKRMKKIRVPHLRKINRVLSGFWLLFNLVFAVSSMYSTSGTDGLFIFLFFGINAYICYKMISYSRMRYGDLE